MSALPASMKARLDAEIAKEKEMEDAANAASAVETTPEETVVETQVSTPVVETPIAPDANYAKLASKIDDLMALVNDLRTENERLKAEANKPPPVVEEPEVIPEELTDAEKSAFKQSLPTIEKVAKKLANEMTSPLRKELKELRARLDSTETSYASMSEGMFVDTLKQRIPDMMEKLANPRWKTYVSSKIPRTNLTIGQALIDAHKARNPQAIKEIFDEFLLADKQLEAHVVPGTVRSTQPPKKPETLKFTDRKKLSEDFIKGRISKERFDELVAKYDKAEQEGRVNFDS